MGGRRTSGQTGEKPASFGDTFVANNYGYWLAGITKRYSIFASFYSKPSAAQAPRCLVILGKFINPYIWCAVGALVGFFLGEKKADDPKLGVIENILVGVFGAFIGGDLIVSQLNHGLIDDKVFKFGSLLWAIGGAVGAIMLLRLLRRSVGPMRVAKKRKDDSF